MCDPVQSSAYEASWFNGWMTCGFMSFSTVFQPYQDVEQVIMKGCVQWNTIYNWKDPCIRQGSNPEASWLSLLRLNFFVKLKLGNMTYQF